MFSVCTITKKLHEGATFPVLSARTSAGDFPAHRMSRDSRALHLQELAARLLNLARKCGLFTPVAVDSSKATTKASSHKVMTIPPMVKAEPKAELDALLQSTRPTDQAQSQAPEFDIPEDLARVDKRQPEADRASEAHFMRSPSDL
jgi:hypothetical protein